MSAIYLASLTIEYMSYIYYNIDSDWGKADEVPKGNQERYVRPGQDAEVAAQSADTAKPPFNPSDDVIIVGAKNSL